jgi:hypothetical protein
MFHLCCVPYSLNRVSTDGGQAQVIVPIRDLALLESPICEIELDDATGVAAELLEGRARGRVVARVGAP